MDPAAYLARIGYDADTAPSLRTLRRLHRDHLTHIPFENLDLHLGRPILLDEPSMFDKIVTRRHGGFCYELNGLFAWLLERLGFEVSRHSAGVMTGGRVGPEFDHLALLVQLDEPWLVDVGFGQSFRDPLRLVRGIDQIQGDDRYRLVQTEQGVWLTKRRGDEPWATLYRFSLTASTLAEFGDMCRHHQESPDSSFTRQRVCSIETTGGRVTLAGMTLIETAGDERRETPIGSDGEYRQILLERFGVELGGAEWRRRVEGGRSAGASGTRGSGLRAQRSDGESG